MEGPQRTTKLPNLVGPKIPSRATGGWGPGPPLSRRTWAPGLLRPQTSSDRGQPVEGGGPDSGGGPGPSTTMAQCLHRHPAVPLSTHGDSFSRLSALALTQVDGTQPRDSDWSLCALDPGSGPQTNWAQGLEASRWDRGQGMKSRASVDSIPKCQPKGGSASQREHMGACCPLSPSSEPSGGLFRHCFSNLGPGPCLTTKDYWGPLRASVCLGFYSLMFTVRN